MAGENQDYLARLQQEEPDELTTTVNPAGTRTKVLPSGATVRLKGAPAGGQLPTTGERQYTLGQKVARFLAPVFMADPNAVSGPARGAEIVQDPYQNLRYTPATSGGFQPKVQTTAAPGGDGTTDKPDVTDPFSDNYQVTEQDILNVTGGKGVAISSSSPDGRLAPEIEPFARFKPLGLEEGQGFFASSYSKAYGSIGDQLRAFTDRQYKEGSLQLDRFKAQTEADKAAADVANDRLKLASDVAKPFARFETTKLDSLPGQPTRYIITDKVSGTSETRTADPIFDNPDEAITTLGIDFTDDTSASAARQQLDSLLQAGKVDQAQYDYLKQTLAQKYQKLLQGS